MMLYLMLILTTDILSVTSHGRLKEPPSRASMFRYGFNNPPNYNDNECNCGGFGYQQSIGGKCGICGDNYLDNPRQHEAGGRYANGIITRTYSTAQIIKVIIDITANHKGYFEFRLCPNNNIHQVASQECLDKYVLQLSNGSGTKYHLDATVGDHEVFLKLPDGLVCTQCVLQWRYQCGNSWGISENGTQCIGCGPQEQFYGCSDIAITNSQISQNTQAFVSQTTMERKTNAPVTTREVSPTTRSSNTGDGAVMGCYATYSFKLSSDNADNWCNLNCIRGHCPQGYCLCPDQKIVNCAATGLFKGDVLVDAYCRIHCPIGICPTSYCLCG